MLIYLKQLEMDSRILKKLLIIPAGAVKKETFYVNSFLKKVKIVFS